MYAFILNIPVDWGGTAPLRLGQQYSIVGPWKTHYTSARMKFLYERDQHDQMWDNGSMWPRQNSFLWNFGRTLNDNNDYNYIAKIHVCTPEERNDRRWNKISNELSACFNNITRSGFNIKYTAVCILNNSHIHYYIYTINNSALDYLSSKWMKHFPQTLPKYHNSKDYKDNSISKKGSYVMQTNQFEMLYNSPVDWFH